MSLYYSLMRPISPGTFPKYTENAILDIVNFGEREYLEEIGRYCWGCIEYEKDIPESDARNYELIKA